MRCESCGYESGQDFTFCPHCGAPAPDSLSQTNIVPANTAADKILHALQDPLFFILCILISACCGLQLLGSGLNLLTVLFTIFLWLTYAQARKGIADANHLRCISGTVYAQYILVTVGAILVIVVGVLLGILFSALTNNSSIMQEILSAFDNIPVDTNLIAQVFGALSGAVILILCVLVGAVMLVVNLLSTRYIHRFAKSVYESIQSGTLALQHGKTAYGWLLAFGIIDALRFLTVLDSGNITAVLSSGATCATPIVAALLIKKYLLTKDA